MGTAKLKFYFKWIFLALLVLLIIVLILQNSKTCDVKILSMTVTNVPIFLLILCSALVGVIIGVVITVVFLGRPRFKKE